MANKEVKFTEDEMKEISKLQQTYLALQNTLGQVGVARIKLEQQLNDLDSNEDTLKSQFVENQSKEKDFVDQINKKYGDGNLDLSTGVFTPRLVEETTTKTDKTL